MTFSGTVDPGQPGRILRIQRRLADSGVTRGRRRDQPAAGTGRRSRSPGTAPPATVVLRRAAREPVRRAGRRRHDHRDEPGRRHARRLTASDAARPVVHDRCTVVPVRVRWQGRSSRPRTTGTMRTLLAVAAASAALLSATATASAGIWTAVPSGTTETITALDHRADKTVFGTANGKIFTLAGGQRKDFPGPRGHRPEAQPVGDDRRRGAHRREGRAVHRRRHDVGLRRPAADVQHRRRLPGAAAPFRCRP